MIDMTYICPVCGYDKLIEPPWDENGEYSSYEICSSCGVEYGVEEKEIFEIEKEMIENTKYKINSPTLISWWKIIRNDWIKKGCIWKWKDSEKPAGWNPNQQLKNVDYFLKKYEKTGKLDFKVETKE